MRQVACAERNVFDVRHLVLSAHLGFYITRVAGSIVDCEYGYFLLVPECTGYIGNVFYLSHGDSVGF